MLGATEIAIIAAAIGVFCFGPAFLRKAGQSAADTIREFRKVKAELHDPVVVDTSSEGRGGVKAKEGN